MRIRLNGAVAVLSILPSVGCRSWAAVRVHDANRVAVHVGDDAELAGGSGPTTVNLTSEMTAERRADGAITLDVQARGTPGPLLDANFEPVAGTQETLVDADGNISASAYVPNAEALYWDGEKLVVRHVYARYEAHRRRRPPFTRPFEVRMTTPASNVDEIESHRVPIRGLGWVALGVATLFAAGTVALASNSEGAVAKAGPFMLGVPALTFGGASAVLLTWPESVTRQYPSRDVAFASRR